MGNPKTLGSGANAWKSPPTMAARKLWSGLSPIRSLGNEAPRFAAGPRRAFLAAKKEKGRKFAPSPSSASSRSPLSLRRSANQTPSRSRFSAQIRSRNRHGLVAFQLHRGARAPLGQGTQRRGVAAELRQRHQRIDSSAAALFFNTQ